MKNRRTIIECILCAVLGNLRGTACNQSVDQVCKTDTDDHNGDQKECDDHCVYFSSASTQDGAKATATVDPTDNDKATITVVDGTLNTKNDNAVVYLEINNDSDLTVYITTEVTGLDTDYFNVQLQYARVLTGYATIAPGDTLDVGVTVSCVATPTEDKSTTFDITFNASTAAPTNP